MKIWLKIIAGCLGIVGFYGLINEPHYIVDESSPEFAGWIKWVGLIAASGAIIAHFIVDIMEIIWNKGRSLK